MSEARNQRFEIDIDEIERQLRRSAEAAPVAKADPLAELARIVGQDDPFRGILGKGREPAPVSNVHVLERPAPPPVPSPAPVLAPENHAVLHGYDPVRPEHRPDDHLFDPVAEAYGSHDAAYAADDLQPLRPRRSRGRLAVVLAALLVTAGAAAGGLYWRKSGAGFGVTSGAPPVITADRTPLKVAPQNPGGVEVPNQNRQIYEKGSQDGQSRVVDGREQPIDVREAARTLPAPVAARSAGPSADTGQVRATVAPTDPAPRTGGGTVASALGEPRRVRTVAVRPDGSTYMAATTAALADVPTSLLPGNTPPPPVPVSSIPVSGRTGVTSSTGAAAAMQAPAVETTGAPTGTPVKVLPPVRPKIEPKPARAREESAKPAPVRTASVQPATPAAATEKPAAAVPTKFAVQIAVRPTDGEARQAYSQLQEKFASDLDGKPARVTKAEVGGKTVHRVRVGPLSKDDANALCSRLKASGGSCFVAPN